MDLRGNALISIWKYFQEAVAEVPVSKEWVYSALLIPAMVVGRSILLRLYFKQRPHLEIEEKRRMLVVSRNMMLLLLGLGLFMVWATQIQTFALSMVALAAATVVATKELLMCLSGSLLRMATKQYSVGDYIEVNDIRGRVIDINLFSTLVMQIGSNTLVGRLSGRTISFPNSLLLSQSIRRDNILGNYVVHMFDIPVPIHLDSDEIVPKLLAVLEKECAPYIGIISRYFEEVQMQKMFITPPAQPYVGRVPCNDTVYNLVVRFACPVNKRQDIQETVLDEFIRIQYILLNQYPIGAK